MSVVDELFNGQCPVITNTVYIPDTVGNHKESNRIDELLLVPCSEIVNDTTVLNVRFWSDLFCGVEPLGRRTGVGNLNITEDLPRTIDLGEPFLTTIKNDMYHLTFTKTFYNMDEEYLLFSKLFSELGADGWKKYKVFARRMCDMEDDVMPIGKFALTKHNFTHQEIVKFEIGLSWKQNSFPMPIKIHGLDAVLQCE